MHRAERIYDIAKRSETYDEFRYNASNVALKYVFRNIKAKTKYSIDDIKGSSRKSELVDIRRVICYHAYNNLKMTTKDVGDAINRHYSSVVYQKSKANDFLNNKWEQKFHKLYFDLVG